MKKAILGFMSLAIAAGVSAQAPALGIKGGLNIANLSTSASGTSSRLAPHAGIVLHGHMGTSWAIQPEVLYSGQGMELELNGVEYNWNLNYLNVPIMVQYMFSNGFRVEAGPQVGLLLSANIKDPSGKLDIKDRLTQVDFGVGVGLNYLTYSGFGIGGRYNLGLSDINKNKIPGDPVKNRVGQVSVFYMFNSTHKAKSR